MKIQSSIEYLIVFSGVLTVALISIFLLGHFSNFGHETAIEKSTSYWANKKPLAILEAKVSPTSPFLRLVIKNNDIESIYIKSIETASYSTIGNPSINSPVTSGGSINPLASGDTMVYNVSHMRFYRKEVCTNQGPFVFCHDVYVPAYNECTPDKYGQYIKLTNITITYSKTRFDNPELVETSTEPLYAVCTPND